MLRQSNIQQEFDFSVHLMENSVISQIHLDENRVKFTKKCKETLDLLMSGIKLTVLEAHAVYGISSLPRRIMDLRKDNGVLISDDWILKDGKKDHMYWYMTSEQLKFNREKFLG